MSVIVFFFVCVFFFFFFFFFFQAEDGIRDVAVTGVQTCALPILGHRTKPLPHHRSLWNRNALRFRHDLSPSDRPGEVLEKRSEERRVGKECRSRWWA